MAEKVRQIKAYSQILPTEVEVGRGGYLPYGLVNINHFQRH